MKLSFSILTLLGLTALIAITTAGFTDPAWTWVARVAWSLITLVAFVLAVGRPTNLVIFLRGFLAGCIWFLMIVYFNFFYVERWLVGFLEGRQIEGWWVQSLAVHAVQTAGTIVGLLTGSLALWRYRVLERRAKQEKSGNE